MEESQSAIRCIVYTQKASFFCNRAVTAHAVQCSTQSLSEGPGLAFRYPHRMRIRVTKAQNSSLIPLPTLSAIVLFDDVD